MRQIVGQIVERRCRDGGTPLSWRSRRLPGSFSTGTGFRTPSPQQLCLFPQFSSLLPCSSQQQPLVPLQALAASVTVRFPSFRGVTRSWTSKDRTLVFKNWRGMMKVVFVVSEASFKTSGIWSKIKLQWSKRWNTGELWTPCCQEYLLLSSRNMLQKLAFVFDLLNRTPVSGSPCAAVG